MRFLGSVFEILFKKKVNHSINTGFSNFLISGAIYIAILQYLTVFIRIRNMKDVWMKMYMLAPRLTFYKQLGSGFSLQSSLYFQVFCDSKLLNGCLVV